MQYATRVAEELGLPWVCVRRIAQGLTDALKEVKKEEGEDTVGGGVSRVVRTVCVYRMMWV